MAAKSSKVKAKSAGKKVVKKSAKKIAKKVVKKAAAKKPVVKKAVVKKPVKKVVKKVAAKKPAAKKAIAKKPAAKKVVKKAAVKKTAVKKVAANKAVIKKAVVKKASAKKGVAKEVVAKKTVKVTVAPKAPRPTPTVAAVAPAAPLVKALVPAPAAPAAPVKPAAPVPPPISLKGLRGVSGAKAARIAQIVAESFLPKVTEPAEEPKVVHEAPVSHAANTDTLVSSPEASNEALNAAHKAAAVLFSKKAEDVVLMDLRNLSTVADYYLIATCTNEPQMRSILGTVQRALSREGIKSLRSEYMSGARWAVIDYGDLIVHLFEKQTRGYYSLERLWADAPSTTLKAEDYALPDEADADEDGDL